MWFSSFWWVDLCRFTLNVMTHVVISFHGMTSWHRIHMTLRWLCWAKIVTRMACSGILAVLLLLHKVEWWGLPIVYLSEYQLWTVFIYIWHFHVIELWNENNNAKIPQGVKLRKFIGFLFWRQTLKIGFPKISKDFRMEVEYGIFALYSLEFYRVSSWKSLSRSWVSSRIFKCPRKSVISHPDSGIMT